MASSLQQVKVKLDLAPLKAMEQRLNNFDKFIEAKNKIFGRACRDIEPFVRTLCLESLKRSGLDKKSGELEGWVSKAIVVPTSKGIYIGPPRGLSESDYKKMGGLQYGYQKNQAVKGKKARRTLKHAALKEKRAGASNNAVEAHPFFQLSDASIKHVETAFNASIQRQFDRFMETMKS